MLNAPLSFEIIEHYYIGVMDNKAENGSGGGGWMGFAKNVFNRIVGNKEDKPVIEKKQ
jgi:hypothetical protein